MSQKIQKLLQKHRSVSLFAGALVMIASGVPGAWGVYQRPVAEAYRLTQPQTAMIFSFTIGAFGVFAILAGFVQDQFGPRLTAAAGGALIAAGFIAAGLLPAEKPVLFYLTYSLLAGGGCAGLYPSSMSCVQKWYADKKGFATGVIGCSVGLSGIFITYFSRWVIGRFGVRASFFTLGAVLFALVLLGAFFLLEPPAGKEQASKGAPAHSFAPRQVLKTKQYYLLLLAVIGSTAAVQLFTPLLVEIGKERGLSEDAAVFGVALSAFANAAGRLTMPWVSDKTGRRACSLALFLALVGLSVWFRFAEGVFVIVVFSMLTFAYSGQNALLPSITADLYGLRYSGANYGLVSLGMSIGGIAFPLLCRLLPFEGAAHYLAISGCCLGALCIFLLKPLHPKTREG